MWAKSPIGPYITPARGPGSWDARQRDWATPRATERRLLPHAVQQKHVRTCDERPCRSEVIGRWSQTSEMPLARTLRSGLASLLVARMLYSNKVPNEKELQVSAKPRDLSAIGFCQMRHDASDWKKLWTGRQHDGNSGNYPPHGEHGSRKSMNIPCLQGKTPSKGSCDPLAC